MISRNEQFIQRHRGIPKYRQKNGTQQLYMRFSISIHFVQHQVSQCPSKSFTNLHYVVVECLCYLQKFSSNEITVLSALICKIFVSFRICIHFFITEICVCILIKLFLLQYSLDPRRPFSNLLILQTSSTGQLC